MKKFLSITLLAVMLVMTLSVCVNAATAASLPDELFLRGEKYGMTAAEKIKIERYLAENSVSDAQADAIIAKAAEAVALMESVGAKKYDDLTNDKKNELKNIATEAAKVIDVNLVFKKGSVEVYNNAGKLLEVVSEPTVGGTNAATQESTGKLVYTGNTFNVVPVISVIAIIALAIIVKKSANAR